MDGQDNSELTALTAIVTALKPLDPQTRIRVVQSALVLLGGALSNLETSEHAPGRPRQDESVLSPPLHIPPTDIRRLKDQKNPQSANEMAALVAYYLAEAAPAAERKGTIDIDDVQRYFKQAQFRLPNKPQMTLVNAKNAGYFDAAGGGQYRLNPVGYNLVVHSLPRSDIVGPPKRRKKTIKRKQSRSSKAKDQSKRR